MSEALRVMAREHLAEAQPWRLPAVESPLVRAAAAAAARPTVADLQTITDEARREGHQQGLDEGRAAARAELEQQRQQWQHLCDALARPLQQVDEALEQQLAELAALIARRVVAAELRLQPQRLVGIVRAAIGALPAASGRTDIVVHPDTAALLREGLPDADECGWRIVEDATLQAHDCRIVSADSRIDAGVATRLSALIDAALDAALAPTDGADE